MRVNENSDTKKRNTKPAIDIIGKSRCTGCAACAVCCPNNAIEMLENRQGFLEPVVSIASCNGCGLCNRICPIISQCMPRPYNPIVYAGWSLDKKNICKSSSGGIFYELAKEITNEGGGVAGVVWTEKRPTHVMSREKEIIKEMRGSKYLQSQTLYAFRQLLAYKHEKLLFVGTPCQVAAAKNLHDFFGKDYELITCDLICHGVPSYLLFDKYVDYVEKKFEDIAEINFRNKSHGWEDYNIKIHLINGMSITESHRNNKFMLSYLSDIGLRKSCYNCLFRGLERVGDISLGDFWNAPNSLKNYDGTSIIFANSPIGKKYLKKISFGDKIQLKELSMSQVKGKLSTRRKLVPLYREKFLRYVKNNSFDDAFKKYVEPTIRRKKLFSSLRYLGELLSKEQPITCPEDEAKIGLINVSNTKNYGSMMIATNTIYYLSKKIPNATFVILEEKGLETRDRIRESTGCENIVVREPMELKKNLKSIIKNFIVYLKSLVNPWSNKTTGSLGDCYAVLVLGGDTLTESYSIVGPVMSLLDIRSLKMAGKKVCLLGQTLGPFHSWRILLARYVLKNVDWVYTRSQKSYNYGKDRLGLTNISSSADLAFKDLPRQKETLDLRKYGINVKDRYITLVPSSLWSEYSDDFSAYIDGLVWLVGRLLNVCETNDMKLVLLPHVVRSGQDDREIVEKLLKDINSSRLIYIEDILLPYEARKILGNSVLVVSQRMHGAISSLQMGVPAIALSYSIKYSGVIGEYLGLDELVVETDKSDFYGCMGLVMNAVKNVLNNIEEVKDKIANSIKRAKKDVDEEIAEVAKLLANS